MLRLSKNSARSLTNGSGVGNKMSAVSASTSSVQSVAADISEGRHAREPEITLPPVSQETALGQSAQSTEAVRMPATDVIRALDNGGFSAITSVERVAALELARQSLVQQGPSLQPRLEQVIMPQRAMNGFKLTALIARLANDMQLLTLGRSLFPQREINTRGSLASLRWLIAGVESLQRRVAGILRPSKRLKSKYQETSRDDDELQSVEESFVCDAAAPLTPEERKFALRPDGENGDDHKK